MGHKPPVSSPDGRSGQSELQAHFGRRTGAWLHEASHGIDEQPVITFSEPKSISRETTFERDLHPRHDRAALSQIFTALCTRVAEDLQRKGYVSRTIGVKLRYEDFRTVTRDVHLPAPSADARIIRRAAGQCLQRVPLDKKLRLPGVRAAALSSPHAPAAVDGSPQAELPQRCDSTPSMLNWARRRCAIWDLFGVYFSSATCGPRRRRTRNAWKEWQRPGASSAPPPRSKQQTTCAIGSGNWSTRSQHLNPNGWRKYFRQIKQVVSSRRSITH